MTLAEFVRNNAGINAGADPPADYLAAIYTAISADEIRMLDKEEPLLSAAAWRHLAVVEPTPPPPPHTALLHHPALRRAMLADVCLPAALSA